MTGYEWVPGGGVMQCDEFSTAMPILRSHCAQGSSGFCGPRRMASIMRITRPMRRQRRGWQRIQRVVFGVIGRTRRPLFAIASTRGMGGRFA